MVLSESTRKKQYHAKVLTGCTTCRRRRVKCDERKPTCMRCCKASRECGGYEERKFKLLEAQRTSLKNRTPISAPVPHRYGAPEEVKALAFFLRRTAPMLSMSGPSKELWTILVPQASWRYPEVKNMLVALSFLDQYLIGHLSGLHVEAGYQYALLNYGKALSALASTRPPLSCAVLVSILAWVFEIITNRAGAATIHSNAAKAMLLESSSSSIESTQEDLFIIGYVQHLVHTGEYCYATNRRKPERLVTSFADLDAARQGLTNLVEGLLKLDPFTGAAIEDALNELDEWRAKFELYRYFGPETVNEKRSVFLAHNVVGTYLEQLSATLADGSSGLDQRQVHCVLNDIEFLLEYENICELRWILQVILQAVIDGTRADNDNQTRATRLRSRLADPVASNKEWSNPWFTETERHILQCHNDLTIRLGVKTKCLTGARITIAEQDSDQLSGKDRSHRPRDVIDETKAINASKRDHLEKLE